MKQMRVGLSLVWVGIFILTLVLTAFAACAACQPAQDADEIVLYETTKVFTEEEAENVLEFTEDRDTIVFEEVTAFVADIEPGDVLVSEYPVPGGEYGFLERVIEVSDDGRAVEVEPATLEDVIEQGVIVVNQTIPVEDLMADAMWAPGVQVLQISTGYNFDFSPMTGVTIHGHLTVTADAKANLEASFWSGLQSFEFVFSPGFEMGASLETTAGVSWEEEWTLGKAKAVIPIWGPVALNLGIDLVVGTTGNIEVKLETSVTYQRGYDIGFRYDKDAGWSTINKIRGGGADVNEPTLEGKVEGRVYGGIVLSASVGVSYVLEGGLELELLGNVKGSGIVKTPPDWKCEYDFELYLTAQLAVGLDALLIGDVKYEFEPWRWPAPPEYNLAYGASGQVTTVSGQALPGVTITFSDGRAPTETDTAGHWCKHLSTGPVTATPHLDGYTFKPQSITMTESESNYDFVATKEVQYRLTTSSTKFGDVADPGEGTFNYTKGRNVPLLARQHNNGRFTNWTGDNAAIAAIAEPHRATTSITMNGNYTIKANFEEVTEYCGDGKVQNPNGKNQTEECDPGDPDEGIDPVGCPEEGDFCSKNCTCEIPTANPLAPSCGDGVVSECCEECDPKDPSRPCPSGEECIRCQCEPAGYGEDIPLEESLKVGGSAICDCDFTVIGGYYGGYYICDCGYTSYTSQYECGCSFPTYLPQYVICYGCTVTLHLWVQDLTGGSCPIESVHMELGEDDPHIGTAWFSVPGPYEEFFEYTFVWEGWDSCGETTRFKVGARNSCGTETEFIGYIVCPPQSS
jgi:hypothetical protein